MADSEHRMTMEQRIMVQNILTGIWLAMDFNIDTERFEFSGKMDGKVLALSKGQMDELADAINKI